MSVSYSLACSDEFELFERNFYVPIIEDEIVIDDSILSAEYSSEFFYILEEYALQKNNEYDYQSLKKLTSDLKENDIETVLKENKVKYSFENIMKTLHSFNIYYKIFEDFYEKLNNNYGVIFNGGNKIYLFKNVNLEAKTFIRLNTKDISPQDRIHFSFADDRIINQIQILLDSYGFDSFKSYLDSSYFSGLFVKEEESLHIFNEIFKDKTDLVNDYDTIVKKIKENEELNTDVLDGLNSYRYFLYHNGRYTLYV